jgi:hypothetical protein
MLKSVFVPFGVAAARQKRGCAQCARPGLRIGSYICRTGPDSACFREFPVYTRAGMQFESHLGHA